MILLYHHIAPSGHLPRDAERAQAEGWRFTHSPAAFEWQLRELARRGHRFLSLPDLLTELGQPGGERPNSVAVTFDDGWIDNFEFALPILKNLGVSATFFVTTAHLRLPRPDGSRMAAGQLRDLAAQGFTVGSHTRNHPDLTSLSVAQAREELAGSKADLEQVLGAPIDLLAYPGGGFNARVVELARETGYRAACSVLGPHRNDLTSLFWLYRDVLSPGLNTWGDRYRLSRRARQFLAFRVQRRLRARLAGNHLK